jgi:hypothetical protein
MPRPSKTTPDENPDPDVSPLTPQGEILKRRGISSESLARLGRKAAEAERFLGIHGLSTTAGESDGPYSQALRGEVVSGSRHADTQGSIAPHGGVAKPVTKDIGDLFNLLFGRRK